MPRLKHKYDSEILPELEKEFSYGSVMEVPRITKITLNMGLGEAVANKNVLQSALSDLEKIAGQKAVVTKAKRSEANFKIRTGWPIGAKVTLRRD
ncbi:MAG: 50S ribosomal protein L5, partial [Gammaproteobacteria bacterium]|nr:50S ribosomal protein L5 [Gammaproteobacteria bacterium]